LNALLSEMRHIQQYIFRRRIMTHSQLSTVFVFATFNNSTWQV